jgi:hypothetical protein
MNNADNTIKEWAVVRVPCTDGIERLGLDYDCDWPKPLQVLSNLTYNEAIVQCEKQSQELNMPVYSDEYDVDWRKIEY